VPTEEKSAPQPLPPDAIDSKAPAQQPNPRALAALHLTRQGRTLIKENRTDDAIRALEQAVGLDPNHGPNYYYLSEAWLLKGDVGQAREFHDLAALYLKGNRDWKSRLRSQARKLQK
jgi:tetratricopeptide (TPR) repeat protein